MIFLITGASHTGKTLLAQRLLEQKKIPYLSIDHLKMGLIRSHQTDLTPMDDDELTAYLWPIVREMIKTAIENNQNLTVEGCYVPAGWEEDFDESYLREIRFLCLAMTRRYLEANFSAVLENASAIEARIADDYTLAEAIADNEGYAKMCAERGYRCLLIDTEYAVDVDIFDEM